VTATAPYSPPTCPRCGRSLPFDAPAGLCPQCLLSDGFGDQSEPTGRFTGRIQPRFIPPTIEELASEFPQLDFVRLLGSGGMGAVYLANQVRLARPVAVKILPPDLADDAAFAERFLREARALARLSHPNIVGVFDFGQTPGGLYYFLMEYIEGPTLRQVVANRSAEPKQALEIVRQVCDALQYAHDKGVVHRDIKPENVLLDNHGRVKIADFGLAKLLGLAETAPGSPAAGSLTGTRQAMGTPHYMAPEQIMGSRSVDHRADIYSLGVVFYELLTGELPLGRFAPPSRKVQVDVRLDDVVLRTLEAEPEQRYQKASDVKTDVESISFLPPQSHSPVREAFTARRDVQSVDSDEAGRTVFDVRSAGTLPRSIKLAWAFALVAVLCVMFVVACGATGGGEAAAICAAIVGWFGIPAAICATVLPITTIGEIRRSEGRLWGLVPAVAVAVAIPLVVLDGLIWFVCLLPGFLFAENILGTHADDPALVIASLIAVPVALLVDFCVLRFVWQWATRGLSRERIERELSVIPSELQELGAKVVVFLDKVLRALKPIRRRQDWRAAPRMTPQPVAQYVPPPTASPAPSERPILRPVEEPFPSPPADLGARLSRKAIIGVAWLAWITLAVLFFIIAETNRGNDAIELLFLVLGALCSIPATTAPFVTTILGWIAVGDIRRSRGRLIGLPLAVFDGLFFPLLLLDWVLFALAVGLGLILTRMGFRVAPGLGEDGSVALVAIPIGLIACTLIDFMIVKEVWKRMRLQAVSSGDAVSSNSSWSESRREDASFLRRHRELFAAGLAIGVAALLFGIKAIKDSGFPGAVSHDRSAPFVTRPVIVHRSEAARATAEAGIAENAERDSKWYLGEHGPELGTYWSHISDPIDAHKQSQIEPILRETCAAYVRLLEEHTTAERHDRGVTFKIDAFPFELESLTDRFWLQVDPLLSREEQAVMRYNFPLRFDQRRNSHSSDVINNTLLLFGAERATISIERNGLWFRWSFSGPTNWSGTTPELPRALSGWEDRLDRVLAAADEGDPVPLRSIPVVAAKPVVP